MNKMKNLEGDLRRQLLEEEKTIDFSVPIGMEKAQKLADLAKKLARTTKNDMDVIGIVKNLMIQTIATAKQMAIYSCNSDIGQNPYRNNALNLLQELILLRNSIDFFLEEHTIAIRPEPEQSMSVESVLDILNQVKQNGPTVLKRDTNPEDIN